VEVIVMGITARRLMKNPGGSPHCLRGGLEAGRVAKKAHLEIVGAEEPLHARSVVHDEGAHEVPVARFVETKDTVREDRDPKTIELQPTIARRSQSARVSRKEHQIGVASGAMRSMPGLHTAARARQVTDAKRVTAWKRIGHFARSALDGADQRWGAVARALSRTKAPVAVASIGEGNRLV
jgi:hypothetical protein